MVLNPVTFPFSVVKPPWLLGESTSATAFAMPTRRQMNAFTQPGDYFSYRMEASHRQIRCLGSQYSFRYGVAIDKPPFALPISGSTYCKTLVAFCAVTRPWMVRKVRRKTRCTFLSTIFTKFLSCCRRKFERERF
jgi:hypothetical protein